MNRLSQAKAALRKRLAEQKAKAFLGMCREAGLPEPVREYRFDPERRWRFDYAWPSLVIHSSGNHIEGVALEVEGGAWGKGKRCPVCKQSRGGRHTRGAGFVKDLEKYNRATVLGWRILRVTPQQLCSSDTIAMLKALLQ